MLGRAFLALAAALVLASCGVMGVQAPPVAPGQTCEGLAPDICQREVANLLASRPGERLTGFHMRCVKVPCTAQSGEALVEIAWANGSAETYTSGWAGAEPAIPGPIQPEPALTLEPTCVGLPRAACQDMAEAALDDAGGAPVAEIRITCERAGGCDDRVGEGTAVVVLADDTELVSTWGYDAD